MRMHQGFTKALLTLPVLVLVGCASAPSPGSLENRGTFELSIGSALDGYTRSYRLHIPEVPRPMEPVPLVVVLHGAFSTSAAMEKETGFSNLADREGFVVAYPDGIGIFGLLQHWNAGHCCGKAAADELDDVGFVATVIEDVKRFAPIDPRRIYMVGFSNGAMLTHRFAAERPELLAGAAPLAGAIGSAVDAESSAWQMPSPRAPVPMIMFHGLADTTVPYGATTGNDTTRGRDYTSAADALRFWSSHNGCERHQRAPVPAFLGVVLDSWSDCVDDAAVQLYTLGDWGHRWPRAALTDETGAGDAYYGFDAAEIIWSFFKQHERPLKNT